MSGPGIGGLLQLFYYGRSAWLAIERFWTRLEAGQPQREQITQAEISQALGFMYSAMERFPGAIMDEATMPFPKARMKLAFQVAWLQARSDVERAHHEVGFKLLAQFQPGVGPLPINLQILPSMPPEQCIRIMRPWLDMQPRLAAEEHALEAEWRAFAAASGPKPANA